MPHPFPALDGSAPKTQQFNDVPEMGITRQLLDEVYPDRGDGGVWNRYPERAIVGAAVYFALMGLAELTVLRSRSGAAVR